MTRNPGRSSAAGSRGRLAWLPWAILAALLLLGFSYASYAPLRKFRFIQDDHPIVQLNPIVHRGNPAEIFTTDYWAGVRGNDVSLYRPATLLSFALERGADGRVEPTRAHVINVLLHGAASCLLLLLALRLRADRWIAGTAALLFAVHPIHVSAVAPLTGRGEILALLFSLAALCCQTATGPWLPSTSPGRPVRHAASWGAGAFVFLALGSKEVALATPLLLVALELLYRRPTRGRDFFDRVTFLAPSALALTGHLVLRARAIAARAPDTASGGILSSLQEPPISDNLLVGLGGLEALATRLGLAGRYAMQLLFPARLSADYSGDVIRAEQSLVSPLPLLGLLTLALLCGLALYAAFSQGAGSEASSDLRQRRRLRGFAACLFLLPYLVMGNLVVLVGVAYAERLIYFSSAGFCLLLGVVVGAATRRAAALDPPARTLVGGGLIVLVGVLAALGAWHTHRESRHWRNEETLFTVTARRTPASPRAHWTLAQIFLKQRRYDEALERLERTIELLPRFSAPWYEKGLVLAGRGDFAGAEASFRRTVEINPRHAHAQLNLGIALHRRQRLPEAEQQLRGTLSAFPWMTQAAAELGHVLMETGRHDEAAALYRRAIDQGRTDLNENLERAERLASRQRVRRP